MDKFLKGNIPQKDDKTKKQIIPTEKPVEKKIPWVEKYRPNKLDEVVSQNSVINALQNTKRTGKLQHLLLYGPPGTGKTSTILAVILSLKFSLPRKYTATSIAKES
jgi:replication-associated recombination protein RarA